MILWAARMSRKSQPMPILPACRNEAVRRAGRTFVGWAEWSESHHERRVAGKMVGLAPLGPPYTLRQTGPIWPSFRMPCTCHPNKRYPRFRPCFYFLSLEQHLAEQVQVVLPDGPLMPPGIDVPDVRHLFLRQGAEQRLAGIHEPVLIAAREPNQPELLRPHPRKPNRRGSRTGQTRNRRPRRIRPRCFRPMPSACPPPIESPATARCSRSARTA